MNALMGYLWWGRLDYDLILIGTVDAFVVAIPVGVIVITLVRMLQGRVEQSKLDWLDTFDNVADIITIHDAAMNVVKANKAARRLLNMDDSGKRSIKCHEAYHGLMSRPGFCPADNCIKTNTPVRFERFEPHLNKFYEITVIPRFDDKNQSAGTIHVARDITERKNAEEAINRTLKDREMLVREMHHRTKNNLMIIQSLLNLQSSKLSDAAVKDMLTESKNRVLSIGLIHEMLYKADDLRKIDFAKYLRTLCERVFESNRAAAPGIGLHVDCIECSMDINTVIPCGLIVNELLTNAMRHAFPDGRKGDIFVTLCRQGGDYTLTVRDTGIGVAEGIDISKAGSLGMTLVASLAAQLRGSFEHKVEGGTEFRLVFSDRAAI